MTKKQPKISLVSEKESNLFRESIGKVTPIKNDRIPHQAKKNNRRRPVRTRNYPAVDKLEISYEESSHNIASNKTLRQLREGKLTIDGHLDLHGKTQLQAEHALEQFLQQASYLGLRCLLIIHGKGINSSNNIPILKEFVHYYLSQHSETLNYCSSAKKHGGMGATYALLRQHYEGF